MTSNMSSNLLGELCCALLHRLALHMDRYAKEVHMTRHDVYKPAPALRHQSRVSAKPYVVVRLEAVWQLMEKANATGNSLRGAIALKSDELALDCSESRCDLWTNGFQQMYDERAFV